MLEESTTWSQSAMAHELQDSGSGGSDHDSALALLQAATKTKQSLTVHSRLQYEKLLLTFKASTYCAKPACLSPLICARFG
jgi:hypothetical protein